MKKINKKLKNKIHSWALALLLSVCGYFILNYWIVEVTILQYIFIEIKFVILIGGAMYIDKNLNDVGI